MSAPVPVSIARCASYDPRDVSRALVGVLEPLGSMRAYVSPGQSVFVKVNLLLKATPDRAVTTHPELVRAVIRAVKSCGADAVAVGDSLAGRTTPSSARAVFEASGIGDVCRDEGARIVVLDEDVTRVPAPAGRLYSSFNVGRQAVEADVLIDLPKMKTHGFMMFTGAVKNLFGCIPGLEKAQFHLKVPDRPDFADMLIDLMLACAPDLSIMDAVVAMEGAGPSGGTPRQVGALLASADPIALDVVAAAVAGFDPMEVYTNSAAARRGLGPESADDVEVAGVPWREVRVADFRHPASDVSRALPPAVARWVRKRTASRPFLERPADCTVCETCAANCPVDTITMTDRGPDFDLDRCIRCYCCQELCPQQAIGLRTPWLVRTFLQRGSSRRAWQQRARSC